MKRFLGFFVTITLLSIVIFIVLGTWVLAACGIVILLYVACLLWILAHPNALC